MSNASGSWRWDSVLLLAHLSHLSGDDVDDENGRCTQGYMGAQMRAVRFSLVSFPSGLDL